MTQHTSRSWPARFGRWLFGSPFRGLPRAFGSPVPTDLQAFEAQADAAAHRGLGGIAARAPTPHQKTRPERLDSSLERQ
jgi:hypothetical protein